MYSQTRYNVLMLPISDVDLSYSPDSALAANAQGHREQLSSEPCGDWPSRLNLRASSRLVLAGIVEERRASPPTAGRHSPVSAAIAAAAIGPPDERTMQKLAAAAAVGLAADLRSNYTDLTPTNSESPLAARLKWSSHASLKSGGLLTTLRVTGKLHSYCFKHVLLTIVRATWTFLRCQIYLMHEISFLTLMAVYMDTFQRTACQWCSTLQSLFVEFAYGLSDVASTNRVFPFLPRTLGKSHSKRCFAELLVNGYR